MSALATPRQTGRTTAFELMTASCCERVTVKMKRNALITFVSAVVIRVALLVVFFSFKNRQSATVDPGRRSGLHGVQMPAVVRRDIPASVEKSVERGKLGVEILKFPDAEEIEMRFRNPEPFGRGEY